MPSFSRTTIIALTDLIGTMVTSQFDRLLLRYGLEDDVPPSLGSMPRRINVLSKYLIDNPTKKGILGSNLTFELIEEELERNKVDNWRTDSFVDEKISSLAHSLKRDGFTIDSNSSKLKTSLPDELQPAVKENELFSLLDEFQLSTTKGHFEQAVNAHTRGEWASANSQLRTFVESLFDAIAERIKKDDDQLPESSHNRREFLAKLSPPFLLTDLNEWEIGNKGGFIQGFWKRLHPAGSHPGLSDDEDSTFRLHLVILIAHHFLNRLKRYMYGIW